MRNIKFGVGEYYHVYNRGVDHRQIVMDEFDSNRFILGLELFNSVEPIGSLYEYDLLSDKEKNAPRKPLVNIICYILNPNHYHFALEEIREGGISEFMKRLGGYAYYFNLRHKRTGSLFEGRYKIKHVETNGQLLHLSGYINLNDKVHGLGGRVTKLVKSSLLEYIEGKGKLCKKGIVLDQFDNVKDYEKFILGNLEFMKSKKEKYRELEDLDMGD